MKLSIYIIFTFFLTLSSLFAQKKNEHKVQSGETFYYIAKKYNLSVEELKTLNPSFSIDKLQIGQKITIKNTNTASKDIIHIVKKGETISKITDIYNVNFKTLKQLNANLDTNLQIGEKIIIKSSKILVNKEIIEPKIAPIKIISPTSVQNENLAEAEDGLEEPDDSGEITHVIKTGETLNSIAQKYAIELNKIKELNPRVTQKIFPGRKLIIKKGTSQNNTTSTTYNEIEDFVEEAPTRSFESLESADLLVAISSEHLGTKYRSGGMVSGGFDCSGLMCYTFNQIDFKLPRTSNEQSRTGKKTRKSQAQKGDLIFFSTNGRGTINHVGMITEIIDKEIFFIHSSVRKGVVVSSLNESYYSKRFIQINRVLE